MDTSIDSHCQQLCNDDCRNAAIYWLLSNEKARSGDSRGGTKVAQYQSRNSYNGRLSVSDRLYFDRDLGWSLAKTADSYSFHLAFCISIIWSNWFS